MVFMRSLYFYDRSSVVRPSESVVTVDYALSIFSWRACKYLLTQYADGNVVIISIFSLL